MSPEDRLRALGERSRALRIARQLKQSELAERAGVGVATIKRFESHGTATLENALRIATALTADAPFDALFAPPAWQSIDEALAEAPKPRRVRKRP